MLLSDVCLSRTPGLSREQRPIGRPKLAQGYPTSHVTRRPLSRSKGQGHQADLLASALTRQAAAAVSVGTYSAWETIYCSVVVCSAALGASAPSGWRRWAGAYRGARPPTACYYYYAPSPGGGIKRWCSDVCLSRTSGLSWEQRGTGIPKLAQR